MITMVMELPKNRDEREVYENKIISNQNYGKGMIYKGEYYFLEYRAHTPNTTTLHCEGIVLTIRRNKDQSPDDFAPLVVPYTEEVKFIDGLKGRPNLPFKARLKIETNNMIQKIKDHDEHLKRVSETADNIVACKIKIDDIMSEITEGQAVSYTKMIEDQERQKALPEHTESPPLDNINPADYISLEDGDIPEQNNTWHVSDSEKKNHKNNINVVLDEAARTKRANDVILNAEYRIIHDRRVSSTR